MLLIFHHAICFMQFGVLFFLRKSSPTNENMAWLWIFFFSELGIVVGRGLLPQKALATEGGQSHSIRRPGCPAAVCMYVCMYVCMLVGCTLRNHREA